ncbi:unnamed protein product [Allacma fusca]|uniref:Saccharopine dehydrogenase n=1 Tax=Allacma fusca TaxID=39272 RepID=A0A8J2LH33_9HEXA|nr:unnamed protein product [Allacma fusca]
MKKALVLGSGFVSEPLVEYLTRESSNVTVTLASILKDQADTIASKYPRVKSIFLDVTGQPDLLSKLIGEVDIVVSLLPPALHPRIASVCIKNKVNMVTASYCLPPLAALSEEATNAGVSIINEVGLDPGIDHLLAMECFDEIHSKGGKVESFISYCGGLPAPEASHNALRYKFSWSPRCALFNTLNPAKYLKDGEIVEIPAGGALMDAIETRNFLPGLQFEGHPNRDSLMYKKLYGIPEAATILRGTLRYQGNANAIKALHLLGLIDPKPIPALDSNNALDISWRQLICQLLHHFDEISYDNLKHQLLKVFKCDMQKLDTIESLGLLDDVLVQKMDSPLDTLSNYLSQKLAFGENERDLVALLHEVQILWPDGSRELREINLIAHGEPGEIKQKGTVGPFTADIYQPMLNRLRGEGIVAETKSKFL